MRRWRQSPEEEVSRILGSAVLIWTPVLESVSVNRKQVVRGQGSGTRLSRVVLPSVSSKGRVFLSGTARNSRSNRQRGHSSQSRHGSSTVRIRIVHWIMVLNKWQMVRQVPGQERNMVNVLIATVLVIGPQSAAVDHGNSTVMMIRKV